MRRTIGLAVALSVLFLSTGSAWSWGLSGHRAIGMIADILLADDRSGLAAAQLLGGISLSEAGTWADCVKGQFCGPLTDDEKAYVHNNPLHATYHYTDVPIQQPRYRLGMAGTRYDDVVQVTKQAINVLRGRASNNGPAVLDRKSALWVMAHMVGDLHQPLHVGALYFADDCAEEIDPNVVAAGTPVVSTRGGNDLIFHGKSFHVEYWDNGTVIGAMRLAGVQNKSIDEFAKYVVAHPPRGWETPGDPETWPEQWATEVLPVAKTALTKLDIADGIHADNEDQGLKCTWNVTISDEYRAWANAQALDLLSKAGYRLAALVRATMQVGH